MVICTSLQWVRQIEFPRVFSAAFDGFSSQICGCSNCSSLINLIYSWASEYESLYTLQARQIDTYFNIPGLSPERPSISSHSSKVRPCLDSRSKRDLLWGLISWLWREGKWLFCSCYFKAMFSSVPHLFHLLVSIGGVQFIISRRSQMDGRIWEAKAFLEHTFNSL